MSRIGKKEIPVPSGVKITIEKHRVLTEGPKGRLSTPVPAGIVAEFADSKLIARRTGDSKQLRALHGLTRALLANAVNGVSSGFEKKLDVVGIGYRAEIRGRYLNLTLGHSHPIEFPIPQEITVSVEREQKPLSNYVATIKVAGADRYKVGQVAAEIRSLRPPDPYKGKGVRYTNELIKLKEGKKGA